MIEPGQDRKIAALRPSMCVHFLFIKNYMFHVKHRGDYMNEYMKIAFEEAKVAYNEGNVPVGAVIVKNNSVISKSHNIKNTSGVSIYHAEILSIVDACNKIKSWYLDDCIMYVTLKPCKMCEAAIAESRIKKVFYLIDSNYSDNLDANISNINYIKCNNDKEYIEMISNFFKNIR